MTDFIEEERGVYGGGHVKLHRSALESSLWAMRPEDKVLAMTLLLKANWKDAEWFNKYQRKRVTVRRGELITSIENIASLAYLTKKTVRTSLKHLVSDGFIEILKTSENRAQQFTHIRICKYEIYQGAQDQAGTQRARLGHGLGTARATNEEGKEREESKEGKNKELRASRSRRLPADIPESIQTFRIVAKFFPNKILWPQVCKVLNGTQPEALQPYLEEWIKRNYNPKNLNWLFDWFVKGRIPEFQELHSPNGKQKKIDPGRKMGDDKQERIDLMRKVLNAGK